MSFSKGKIALLLFLFLILTASMGALYGYNHYLGLLKPANVQGEDVIVTIPHGSSTIRIANLLANQGIIQDPKAFRIYTRLNNKDGQLKAGEYILSSKMSTPEIVDKIVRGAVVTHPFTIPEGFTLRQITRVLTERGIVDEQIFLELLEKGEFDFPYLDQLIPGPNRFEGFLFPDTYYITSYMTERDIIQMMLNRFQQVVTPEVAKQAEEKGLSVVDLINIAAMVEREASQDQDRAKIAGVIYNRLKIGMLLQIDATVQYALPEHQSRLFHRHLEIDSPYNTYKHPGLPLGPIAAPGEKSIRAALEPVEHNYYFYVLRPDGSHHFSRNYNEHINAVNKYLRRNR